MSQFQFATFGSVFRITPSDSTLFSPGQVKAMIVDTAGTLTVKAIDGTSVAFAAVSVGQLLPFSVSQVMATGTTATVVGVA